MLCTGDYFTAGCSLEDQELWSREGHRIQRCDGSTGHVVKSQILDGILADGYEPVFVLDDRPSVIQMWRETFGCLAANARRPEWSFEDNARSRKSIWHRYPG